MTSPVAYDTIHWDTSHGDYRKNSDEFIADESRKIAESESWIVEGSYTSRMEPFFRRADIILWVAAPAYKRIYRLAKRVVKGRWPHLISIETFRNTIELVRYSHAYPARLQMYLKVNPEFHAKTQPHGKGAGFWE